jgi:hypothetical protein
MPMPGGGMPGGGPPGRGKDIGCPRIIGGGAPAGNTDVSLDTFTILQINGKRGFGTFLTRRSETNPTSGGNTSSSAGGNLKKGQGQ